MTTEQFSKEEFDAFAEKNGIEYGSLEQGEHTYIKPISEWSRIIIRSSLGMNGFARGTGDDSIRIWLEVFRPHWNYRRREGWMAIVSKEKAKELGIPRWTTRTPGWQDRVLEKLAVLERMAIHRPMPYCTCGKLPYLNVVKKDGKNRLRPFVSHNCGKKFFVWMDEPIEDEVLEEVEEEYTAPRMPAQPDSNPLDALFNGDVVEDMDQPLPPSPPITVMPDPEVREVRVFELNPQSTGEQAAAITAPLGNRRIIATAGSGKTYQITERVRFLITMGICNPKELVCVTFQKKAANEMKERILTAMPEMKGTPLPNRICTIHAFNLRSLRMAGINRQVVTETDTDFWKIKRELAKISKSVWEDRNSKRPAPGELLRAFHEVKYYGFPLGEDEAYQTARHGDKFGPGLTEARIRFDRYMIGQNLWMFDDMLFEMEQRLIFDKSFRDRMQGMFKVVLVDESQDTNYQAMRILITISQNVGWNEIYRHYNGSFIS